MNQLYLRTKTPALSKPQQGNALFVVISITLIMALLAMGLASTVLSEFKVSRNARETTLARQAAEAALRDAELHITCRQFDSSGNAAYNASTDLFCGDNPNKVCKELGGFSGLYAISDLQANPSSLPAIAWTTGNGSGTVSLLGAGTDVTSLALAYGAKTKAQELDLRGMAQQPRYHIWVDRDPNTATGSNYPGNPIFRIRARGFGAAATTFVELESVYAPCR